MKILIGNLNRKKERQYRAQMAPKNIGNKRYIYLLSNFIFPQSGY